MDEFQKGVQMLLMKKAQDYGELRLLKSRATTENTERVEDILKSIAEVFQKFEVPIQERNLTGDERCVEAYKYLLLNTAFNNQDRLIEDMVHGHLVDMCPPLSPYLFVQTVWEIRYEEILVESLLHLPLDLCVEIAEMARNCVEQLPFDRCIGVLYDTMLNLYARFKRLESKGEQSTDIGQTVLGLFSNFQEIAVLLLNPRVTRLDELQGLKRHERCGLILKLLIRTVHCCLNPGANARPPSQLGRLYKVTFGREEYAKCDQATLEKSANAFRHEMTSLLLKKIKEIDCNIYLAWAELDDKENPSISLQRSIGNDCHKFLEYMRTNERLSEDTHLIECLQQFASKPQDDRSGYALTMQELCHAIEGGKKEDKKELMNRYREWDRSTLEFIERNCSMLSKDDCSVLLDYLTYVLKQPGLEELKEFSYPLVLKLLMQRDVRDIYEVAVEYLTKYDAESHLQLQLQLQRTEETFEQFVRKNSNLRTPTNLRAVLLFILKDPRKILTVLIKITIGLPVYESILISPNDLLLLSPFFGIKTGKNDTLLTEIFRAICLENEDWNTKKFIDLVTALLDSSTISVDSLMNNVFIPYLEGATFKVSNMNSILNSVRKLQTQCTKGTNLKGLTVSLAERMSSLRENERLQRCLYSEICSQITRILQCLLDSKGHRIGTEARKEIRNGIESTLGPLDKMHFGYVWFFPRREMNAIEILQDYERRYFLAIDRLKEKTEPTDNLRGYLTKSSPLREDFLRHLILRSTDAEYRKLGSELTVLYWFIFGWNDEITAYDSFLRLTVDGCCLALEYPSIGPTDLFVFLLRCFTRFCKTFARLEGFNRSEKVSRSVIENAKRLEGSVKGTVYEVPYSAFRARLTNDLRQESGTLLQDLLDLLELFGNQCTELHREAAPGEPIRAERTARVTGFYVVDRVISACLKHPATEAYQCIARMNEIFSEN